MGKVIKNSYARSRQRLFMVRLLDEGTDMAADTSVGGDHRINPESDGTLTAVGFYVDTSGSGGVTTVDVNLNGATILSTKITVDAGEKSSQDAVTPPVLSTTAFTADDTFTFDIDGVPGTAPKGFVPWIAYITK